MSKPTLQETCEGTVEDLVLTKMAEALTDSEIVREIEGEAQTEIGRSVTSADYVAVIRKLISERDGIKRA